MAALRDCPPPVNDFDVQASCLQSSECGHSCSSDGMANGTILIVRRLLQKGVFAEIATGRFRGQRRFIPRMSMLAADTGKSSKYVPLNQKQLPFRPAFAMTINKSQGQTLHHMSLYLYKSVFTHGQFYVALSRCSSRANVKIMVRNGRKEGIVGVYTKNVVYKNALL